MRKCREVFVRTALCDDAVLAKAIGLLQAIQQRSVRFDRVIEVDVRERTRKAEMESRVHTHLATALSLIRLNRHDSVVQEAAVASEVKGHLQRHIHRRRKQMIHLVEDCSIRLKLVQQWWNEVQSELPTRNENTHRRKRVAAIHREYQQARMALARHNVRLVVSIAKRYQRKGLSFLDLIQEGNIGLLAAVEKFDPRRGHRFSTYATAWIMQMMRRAIAEKTRSVRLPSAAAHRMDDVFSSVSEACHRLGRRLSREELEHVAKLTRDENRWIPNVASATLSLDQTTATVREDRAMHESLPQQREELPEDTAHRSEYRTILREILSGWDPRERDIIRLRFGLDEPQTMTLEEIGTRLRISRERVRQLEKASLQRLRKQLSFLIA